MHNAEMEQAMTVMNRFAEKEAERREKEAALAHLDKLPGRRNQRPGEEGSS